MSDVKKAMIGTDKGTLVVVDTIEFEGGLWLVPRWLNMPTEKVRQPQRIIRLDVLPLQRLSKQGMGGASYILTSGHIPLDVLECRTPPEKAEGFVVIDLPEILLPIPDRSVN